MWGKLTRNVGDAVIGATTSSTTRNTAATNTNNSGLDDRLELNSNKSEEGEGWDDDDDIDDDMLSDVQLEEDPGIETTGGSSRPSTGDGGMEHPGGGRAAKRFLGALLMGSTGNTLGSTHESSGRDGSGNFDRNDAGIGSSAGFVPSDTEEDDDGGGGWDEHDAEDDLFSKEDVKEHEENAVVGTPLSRPEQTQLLSTTAPAPALVEEEESPDFVQSKSVPMPPSPQPPAPPKQQNNNPIPFGGGLIMGRLARLLENTAAPDHIIPQQQQQPQQKEKTKRVTPSPPSERSVSFSSSPSSSSHVDAAGETTTTTAAEAQTTVEADALSSSQPSATPSHLQMVDHVPPTLSPSTPPMAGPYQMHHTDSALGVNSTAAVANINDFALRTRYHDDGDDSDSVEGDGWDDDDIVEDIILEQDDTNDDHNNVKDGEGNKEVEDPGDQRPSCKRMDSTMAVADVTEFYDTEMGSRGAECVEGGGWDEDDVDDDALDELDDVPIQVEEEVKEEDKKEKAKAEEVCVDRNTDEEGKEVVSQGGKADDTVHVAAGVRDKSSLLDGATAVEEAISSPLPSSDLPQGDNTTSSIPSKMVDRLPSVTTSGPPLSAGVMSMSATTASDGLRPFDRGVDFSVMAVADMSEFYDTEMGSHGAEAVEGDGWDDGDIDLDVDALDQLDDGPVQKEEEAEEEVVEKEEKREAVPANPNADKQITAVSSECHEADDTVHVASETMHVSSAPTSVSIDENFLPDITDAAAAATESSPLPSKSDLPKGEEISSVPSRMVDRLPSVTTSGPPSAGLMSATSASDGLRPFDKRMDSVMAVADMSEFYDTEMGSHGAEAVEGDGWDDVDDVDLDDGEDELSGGEGLKGKDDEAIPRGGEGTEETKVTGVASSLSQTKELATTTAAVDTATAPVLEESQQYESPHCIPDGEPAPPPTEESSLPLHPHVTSLVDHVPSTGSRTPSSEVETAIESSLQDRRSTVKRMDSTMAVADVTEFYDPEMGSHGAEEVEGDGWDEDDVVDIDLDDNNDIVDQVVNAAVKEKNEKDFTVSVDPDSRNKGSVGVDETTGETNVDAFSVPETTEEVVASMEPSMKDNLVSLKGAPNRGSLSTISEGGAAPLTEESAVQQRSAATVDHVPSMEIGPRSLGTVTEVENGGQDLCPSAKRMDSTMAVADISEFYDTEMGSQGAEEVEGDDWDEDEFDVEDVSVDDEESKVEEKYEVFAVEKGVLEGGKTMKLDEKAATADEYHGVQTGEEAIAGQVGDSESAAVSAAAPSEVPPIPEGEVFSTQISLPNQLVDRVPSIRSAPSPGAKIADESGHEDGRPSAKRMDSTMAVADFSEFYDSEMGSHGAEDVEGDGWDDDEVDLDGNELTDNGDKLDGEKPAVCADGTTHDEGTVDVVESEDAKEEVRHNRVEEVSAKPVGEARAVPEHGHLQEEGTPPSAGTTSALVDRLPSIESGISSTETRGREEGGRPTSRRMDSTMAVADVSEFYDTEMGSLAAEAVEGDGWDDNDVDLDVDDVIANAQVETEPALHACPGGNDERTTDVFEGQISAASTGKEEDGCTISIKMDATVAGAGISEFYDAEMCFEATGAGLETAESGSEAAEAVESSGWDNDGVLDIDAVAVGNARGKEAEPAAVGGADAEEAADHSLPVPEEAPANTSGGTQHDQSASGDDSVRDESMRLVSVEKKADKFATEKLEVGDGATSALAETFVAAVVDHVPSSSSDRTQDVLDSTASVAGTDLGASGWGEDEDDLIATLDQEEKGEAEVRSHMLEDRKHDKGPEEGGAKPEENEAVAIGAVESTIVALKEANESGAPVVVDHIPSPGGLRTHDRRDSTTAVAGAEVTRYCESDEHVDGWDEEDEGLEELELLGAEPERETEPEPERETKTEPERETKTEENENPAVVDHIPSPTFLRSHDRMDSTAAVMGEADFLQCYGREGDGLADVEKQEEENECIVQGEEVDEEIGDISEESGCGADVATLSKRGTEETLAHETLREKPAISHMVDHVPPAAPSDLVHIDSTMAVADVTESYDAEMGSLTEEDAWRDELDESLLVLNKIQEEGEAVEAQTELPVGKVTADALEQPSELPPLLNDIRDREDQCEMRGEDDFLSAPEAFSKAEEHGKALRMLSEQIDASSDNGPSKGDKLKESVFPEVEHLPIKSPSMHRYRHPHLLHRMNSTDWEAAEKGEAELKQGARPDEALVASPGTSSDIGVGAGQCSFSTKENVKERASFTIGDRFSRFVSTELDAAERGTGGDNDNVTDTGSYKGNITASEIRAEDENDFGYDEYVNISELDENSRHQHDITEHVDSGGDRDYSQVPRKSPYSNLDDETDTFITAAKNENNDVTAIVPGKNDVKDVMDDQTGCKGTVKACASDCPCLEMIMHINGKTGESPGLVTMSRSVDGKPIQINYDKLLQNEITKRLLLEKELEACHSTIDFLESTKEIAESAIREREQELDICRSAIASLESSRTVTESFARGQEQLLARKEDEFSSQVRTLQQSIEDLTSKVDRYQNECIGLRADNDVLRTELSVLRDDNGKFDEERLRWADKEAEYETRLKELTDKLEASTLVVASTSGLNADVDSLKTELGAKSQKCDELKTQLGDLKESLNKSEVKVFAQAKDLARQSKRSENEITSLRRQIDSLTQERNEISTRKEEMECKVNEKIARLENEALLLRKENEKLSTEQEAVKKLLERARKEKDAQLKEKSFQVSSLEANLRTVERKRTQLELQLSRLHNLQVQLNVATEEVTSLSKVRDELQGKICTHVEQVNSLESRLEQISNERNDAVTQLEKSQAECKVLQELVCALKKEESKHSTYRREEREALARLREDIATISQDKDGLHIERVRLSVRCQELEAIVEDLRAAAADHLDADQKNSEQVAGLRAEVNALTEERDMLTAERENVFSRCRELEQTIACMKNVGTVHVEDAANELKNEIAQHKETLTHLRENLVTLTQERDELKEMKDNLSDRCHELETSIESMNAVSAGRLENDRLAEESLSVLKDKVESLAKEKASLVIEKDLLHAKFHDLEDTISRLRKDSLHQVEAATEKLHENINILTKERDQLLLGKKDLLVCIEKLEKENVSIKSILADREEKVKNSEWKIDQLREEVENLCTIRNEINLSKAKLTSRCADLEKKLSLLTSDLALRDKELKSREVTMSKLREEVGTISAARDDIMSKNHELISRCSAIESKAASLERAKNALDEKKGKHEETINKLRDELASLKEERRSLDEDNEELLVQLGLLRQVQQQERDSYEASISELQERIFAKEDEIMQLNEMLDKSEKSFDHIKPSVGEPSDERKEKANVLASTNSELQRRAHQLSGEKLRMQKELDDMVRVNTDKMRIEDLLEERQDLLERLEKLELTNPNHDDHKITDFEREGHQDLGTLQTLKERCRNLEELCAKHQQEIKRLSEALQVAESDNSINRQSVDSNELHSMQLQVEEMTALCSERGKEIAEKQVTIDRLKMQIKDMVDGPKHIKDSDVAKMGYDEKLKALENELKVSEAKMRQYERLSEETKEELRLKRDHIASMEIALLNSELDLDARKHDHEEVEKNEKRIDELETTIARKDNEILDLEMQRKSVEGKLIALQAELDMEKQAGNALSIEMKSTSKESASMKELFSRKQEEVDVLTQMLADQAEQLGESKKQVLSLEKDLESKECDLEICSKQIQALELSVRSLKSQLDDSLNKCDTLSMSMFKKEEMLAAEKSKVESLNLELESCRAKLTAEEEETRHLSAELEEEKKERFQGTREATANLLDAVTSKEEAESVDFMREQIISLALALEQSEMQRADALERVLKERKANADSIRRLGDSVKRFYSSLSFGELSP